MKKRATITLKRLAEDLELSVSTVSRALNNHPDISASTKEVICKYAKKMNYHPNLFAKGFRSQKTHIIGLVVPQISNYFTSTIIEGVLNEAEEKGYRVIVSESKNSPKKQNEVIQMMMQFGVDGLLLSLTRKTKDVQSIISASERIPLVLLDKISNKIPCTHVIINEEQAAFEAVEHLIHTGKKNIAIIKETEKTFNSEMRFAGYLKALKKHNLPVDEQYILSTEDISLQHGQRLAYQLLSLQKRPDAIFTITDDCAIGVIKTLKKLNIKIPDDIAVLGFSNSLNSTIISPKLTTVDQPGQKIGGTAVKYLIEELDNETQLTNKTIEIKTHLVVRESTLKL
ncbi:transcriptional regulator, LacI family [Mesonia phycicola]|uniref:Transcriptional regulator, LacI family n=1 Tax=Mesonia phycicola TaxID=579105 RepID=A0A1M6FJF9_9FLAO|nr:LacI family DNA-binding transcriptional regulator [Mesonia phycicola]SHI97837.1 transcriptional regulator, LacI family [Mesonia phycicola]